MIPSKPRILLTNDDGIDAPGLACLEAITESLAEDVWVSAPLTEQSGASRKITFVEPIIIQKRGPKRFAVAGTPSDACFLGLHDLVEGQVPDLVLSGVNRGQNLADDVTVSGTIAAAFQAMKMNVPAVALSQTLANFTDQSRAVFDTAKALGPDVLKRVLRAGWPKDVVLNINFPACAPEKVKGVHVTRHGERDQWHMHAERRRDLRGRTYYWIGFQGGLSSTENGDDLHAIYNDYISITPLRLTLTAEDVRDQLEAALAAPASV